MKHNSLAVKLISGAVVLTVAAGAAVALAEKSEENITVNAAAGDRASNNTYCYEVGSNGNYMIYSIGINDSIGEKIVIPDQFNKKPVYKLCYNMFVTDGYEQAADKVYDISIGKNVSEIEDYAFWGLNIGKVTVDKDNAYFTVIDGMLCTKDGKKLVFAPYVLSGEISLPDSIENIMPGALVSDKITGLGIGASLREVKPDTFEECYGIESFAVSPENAYFSSYDGVLTDKNVTTVYAYPKNKAGEYVTPDTVRIISDRAFSGASSLNGLTLSNVTEIGANSFENCGSLETVDVNGCLDKLGEFAFAGCKTLKNIELPDTLTEIPMGVFSGCEELESFNIPQSLIKVGYKAFDGTEWFNGCNDGFVYIGRILYGYKTSFRSPDGSGDPSKPEKLVIKDGTISVSPSALAGSYTTEINIPSSVKYMDGASIYPRNGLNKISVNKGNTSFAVSDGILFDKSLTKLIAVPETYKNTEYTVPSSVKEIDAYAFVFNKNIFDITVPESVKTFGTNPFYNGDENRAVVCLKNSPAEQAADNDNVSVILSDTGISLNKAEITLGVGEKYQLAANIMPSYMGKAVTWKTSNTSLATVSSGLITAKKTGRVTITAVNIKGDTAKCVVTIKKAPASIKLNKTNITIGVGERIDLGVTLDSGSAAAKRTYTSSDENVVSIDKSKWGCSFAAMKPGKAVVKVSTYNGKTALCNVTVKEKPESISMTKSSITIGVGETVVIGSVTNTGSASNKRVYTTSDSNVAEINPTSWNCSFTGLSVGTAKITVKTYNGKTAVCNVNVQSPPRGIKIAKPEITLGVGETMKLSSVLFYGDASASRIYTSSDKSIVKILKNNWVCEFEAMKPGTAYITVITYNGMKSSCKITVKPAPQKIYLSRGLIRLKVGQTASVSSYLDNGFASANRTYRTSSSKILKMTNTYWTGSFKAIAPGTAYVTVRTQTGVETSCKVIVEE